MLHKMTLAEARLTVLTAQLLPATPIAPAAALERAGFVRTLGGVDAYLAVRARAAGLTRAALDEAVAKREAQVVPAVRGCMYLVARRHVGLCLRVAEALTAARDAREHDKAGIRPGELDALGKAVLGALARGPLATDAIRKALPDGAVRSLGDAGKKLGISSPLPAALRRLEFAGAIERTTDGGRLDTERYLWRRPAKSVFDGVRIPDSQEARIAELARLYFGAAGVAPLAAFAEWVGVSQRDAGAAVAGLGLDEVAIEGQAAPWLVGPGAGAKAEAERGVSFLAFEDNVTQLPGGPGLYIAPEHHDHRVPVWGSSKDERLGDARHLALRPIIAMGTIAGFWEYDPDARAIVTGLFGGAPAAVAKRIAEVAAETAGFLRDQLGHGRSFSLDTDDELRRRAAVVKTITSGKPARAARPASPKASRRTTGRGRRSRSPSRRATPG